METFQTLEVTDDKLDVIIKAYYELEKNLIIGELINEAYSYLPDNLKIEPAPPQTKMRQIRYFFMMNNREIEMRRGDYNINQIKNKSYQELKKQIKNSEEMKQYMDDIPQTQELPKSKPRRKRITKSKSRKK